MSQLMPPLTIDEMQSLVNNPNFKTYVVLGDESDESWKLAEAALNFLPGLQILLVLSEAHDSVREEFSVPGDHVAVIFGRSRNVAQTLSQTEASDFLTVTQAISNA